MSSRPKLSPQVVMNALSLGADAFSLVTNVNMISILSYTIVWTGTPTGQFLVEVSNDYIPGNTLTDAPKFAGTWVPLTLSTQINAVGDSGSAFVDIDTMGAAWVRLHYVFSSGTGTVTATIAGKAS